MAGLWWVRWRGASASSVVPLQPQRLTSEEAPPKRLTEAPRHLTHHKPAMPQPLRWCQEQRGLSGDGLERRGRRDRDRRRSQIYLISRAHEINNPPKLMFEALVRPRRI